MSDIHLHLHVPNDLRMHIDMPEFEAFRLQFGTLFVQLISTLMQLGERMSEASDQLSQAVQAVQTGFDTLNTTLQAEMQQIATALSGAPTDQALRDAATDAVTRLSTLATRIEEMNTQVQGIIP